MVDFLDRGGVSHLITKMLDTVYPVNSIYISLDSTSPASLYGGTWERFGKGKTLVGVDEADTDFKTAGLTGGEKKHKLTIAEMPSHKHSFGIYQIDGSGYVNNKVAAATTYGLFTGDYPTMNLAGGDKPHNNLQPFVSVYIWKRVS